MWFVNKEVGMKISKTAKVLQFVGISVWLVAFVAVGLWPMAVVVGAIAVPAGIAACFS